MSEDHRHDWIPMVHVEHPGQIPYRIGWVCDDCGYSEMGQNTPKPSEESDGAD